MYVCICMYVCMYVCMYLCVCEREGEVKTWLFDGLLRHRCEDFVAGVMEAAGQGGKEEEEEEEGHGGSRYHVITCLSVVKHIHLQVKIYE